MAFLSFDFDSADKALLSFVGKCAERIDKAAGRGGDSIVSSASACTVTEGCSPNKQLTHSCQSPFSSPPSKPRATNSQPSRKIPVKVLAGIYGNPLLSFCTTLSMTPLPLPEPICQSLNISS